MTKISTQGEKANGWVKVNSKADVFLHYLFQSERISGRTKKKKKKTKLNISQALQSFSFHSPLAHSQVLS